MPKVIPSITNIYNIYRLTSKSFFLVLLSLCVSASLAGLFVSSVHAETLDYNVNVEPALNVTIPTDTISLLLDPTNKTFSSQELNISVGTNNPYGYRLTMSSTGTSLVHTEDSNYTIPTLPSLAGGYTDESFIADKWGYKQDSSAWNSYTPGVTLLESNAPVNNDNTNLSFGAKIDYNQAPGNYILVLNFNAVAKVATNDLVITFAGEGVNSVKVCKVAGDCTGDNLVGTVSTSGSSVPGLEDGSTYYLYPTFTSGHEFVSWEKTSTAGTISATDTLNPTFTMSDEPATVTITGKSSMLAMQDITASTCTTTAQTVYDKRDNEQYLIQKLDDGKCWLLDNLRLGSTSAITLTPNDTNINSDWTLPASGTTCFVSTTNCDSSGDDTHTGYTVAAINTSEKNTVNSDSTENWGSGSHKYGVYYNYCAASAGTYCMASSSDGENATSDICPKGWRMPTGGPSGEYQTLCTTVKGSACSNPDSSTNALKLREVLSTPLSGDLISGSANNPGSSGYFWSSTRYNAVSMHSFRVNASNVVPQNSSHRYYGFSVRCVLDERTVSDVTYMQEVNSAVVANTTEGATATLRDRRDNQDYTVAKINGNLWMTKNLAIGCNGDTISSKSLTNADSNVANTSSNPWNTPTTSLTSGNSYDNPQMACSSDYGAWYNYKAATAGTITGSSNQDAQTYDICPAGWRLPTKDEFSGITDFKTAFSPVTGGYYTSGSLYGAGYGYWWSATASNTANRYRLLWNGSSLNINNTNRSYGVYVRCIHSS